MACLSQRASLARQQHGAQRQLAAAGGMAACAARNGILPGQPSAAYGVA